MYVVIISPVKPSRSSSNVLFHFSIMTGSPRRAPSAVHKGSELAHTTENRNELRANFPGHCSAHPPQQGCSPSPHYKLDNTASDTETG